MFSRRELNVEIYALACVIIWLRSKCRENCSYAKTITPKVYQIVCKKKKLKNCSRTIVIFLVYNHLWSYLQVKSLVRTKIKVKTSLPLGLNFGATKERSNFIPGGG